MYRDGEDLSKQMLRGSIRSLLNTFPVRLLIRICSNNCPSKCFPGASGAFWTRFLLGFLLDCAANVSRELPKTHRFQFAPMDPLFIADTVLAIETLSQTIGCMTLLTTVYCSKCEKRGCLHIDLYTKHPILKVIMSANVKRRVPSYRLIHKAPQKAPYVEGYQFS